VIARFLPFSLDMLVAATTPIAVLAGYLVYVAVERPLLTVCRRFRPVPRKLAPSVADV
jgi:peptidoglycan/LPS O-acetylase OafA/YrhL